MFDSSLRHHQKVFVIQRVTKQQGTQPRAGFFVWGYAGVTNPVGQALIHPRCSQPKTPDFIPWTSYPKSRRLALRLPRLNCIIGAVLFRLVAEPVCQSSNTEDNYTSTTQGSEATRTRR